jgi:cytochrome c-type biogenesis protein
MTSDGMIGTDRTRPTLLRPALVMYLMFLMVLLPCLAITEAFPDPGPPRSGSGTAPGEMPLYLAASSVLSPSTPTGGSDSTVNFRASAGLTSFDLGTWSTTTAKGPLTVDGNIQVFLWAQGSGLQSSASFSVTVGVDGQQVGEVIATQDSALTSTPKEYQGTGAMHFDISTGQTISVQITVNERGTGGDLLLGSSDHPSRLVLSANPLTTSTYAETHKAGTSILVRTNIVDVWGTEDIDSVEQYIAGPYQTRDVNIDPSAITEDMIVARANPSDQTTSDVTGSSMNVSWLWSYQGMKSQGKSIKPGIYYLVGTVHLKGSTTTYSNAGAVVISEAPPLIGAAGTAIIVAFVVGGLAVGVYFFALRTDRLKTDKGRAIAALATIGIVVGAGMYAFMVAVPLTNQNEGANAPDFTVTTVDGGDFSLSSQKGKVIVMDLFGTWCPTCNGMMPTLVKLHQRYKGAVFVSVSVEGTGDTTDQIKAFKAKYGADWAFAKDTNKVWQRYQDITDPYIPTLVIINPQGKISYRHVGEASLGTLSTQVEKASKGGFDIGISTQGGDLILVAFIMGILAFFSPCAFPLLPGYMSYVLARREESSKGKGPSVGRSILGGILAALGTLAIFSLAGLLIGAAGSAIVSYIPYLTPIIAIIIAVMGALMLLDMTGWTDKITGALVPVTSRVQSGLNNASSKIRGGKSSNLGLFFYGAGYGVASMGCHASVFVAIMIAGFVAGGFASALLVFVMFGLGMGIMMVAITVLVGMAKGMVIKRMQGAMPLIKKFSGLVLLIAGVYLAWYSLNALMG